MIERKFTDEEIIRLLEEYEVVCDNCACNEGDEIGKRIMTNALDLINRQRAEIAELKQKYELAVAEREANVKALIDMTAEKYPWERVNEKREDD